jgi:hypothetical protein
MKQLAMVVILVACGKAADKKQDVSGSATPPPSASSAAPPPVALKDFKVCDLVTADEVGKIFNKKVVMVPNGSPHVCTFGIDPAEMQNSMAALSKNPMGMVGKGGIKMPAMDQLEFEVSIERDDETEASVKATFAAIGSAAAATKSVNPGLKDVVTGQKDISGVGDWAFSTNVASVNMGAGLSVSGRLLEARSGAWRITISTTISPDPGADKLDSEIAEIARPVAAKLK